ncbi:hypothetical protein [Lysobacter gummosus]
MERKANPLASFFRGGTATATSLGIRNDNGDRNADRRRNHCPL